MCQGDDDCVPMVGVAYVTTVQFPYVAEALVTSFHFRNHDRLVPPPTTSTHGWSKAPAIGRR